MRPLVIIHGWSDEDQSFLPLARAIEQHTGRRAESLWLGHYVSLDDDIRMSDLVQGMSRAWRDAKLPVDPGAADVIVHSNGSLVIRDWMATEFTERDRKPPVRNLLMLAPANHGSPLAHKGRAFYGRVLRGFTARKRFQTGTHILKALEMASPYSRELARRDRFGTSPFRPGGVRATVIVGNSGYTGISSLANEDGSDGTVYVSTAHLDCAYLSVDFPSLPKKPRASAVRAATGETAFLVADGHNHGSVALKNPGHPGNDVLLKQIIRALGIANAKEYRSWVEDCRQETARVMQKHDKARDTYKHGYQNTVIRVRDDQGFDVPDYVVEFYHDAAEGDRDHLATEFNRRVLTKVHVYQDNSAIRSFLINCTELHRLFTEGGHVLRVSLSALPDVNDPKNMVGYRSFEDEDIDCLRLEAKELKAMFVPNRTLFIDITLTRERKAEMFELNRADSY